MQGRHDPQHLEAAEAGNNRSNVAAGVWPAALLGLAFIAAWIAHLKLPAGLDATEYGLPALEFAQTHHLNSIFLSPGYQLIVGSCMVFFPGIAGIAVANISIYLVYVAVVWTLLRQLGTTARDAFLLGMAFALYPDILLSINKVYHNILSPLLLLAFASAAIYLVRSRSRYKADIIMALVTGVAILCRSNLILFLPITWFLLWRYCAPRALLRAAAQAAGVFALYAVTMIATHGSVFWPQVGAYVLFSGANQYTEHEMLTSYDDAAEGSILPALKDLGINAYHDWGKPDYVPGDNEIRNPQFAGIYKKEALKFAESHPWTMVKLCGVKLFTLLRPDLKMYRAGSVGGLIKIFAAFALPIWIGLCVWIPQREGDPSRLIITLTILAFALPLVLSISAPRMRVSVDVLCFLDGAAMLAVWLRTKRRPAARSAA